MDEAHASGMIAIRHAVENASDVPITEERIVAILRGAGGPGSQLRAVFGDASLRALAGAGAAHRIELDTILAAYVAARAAAAAANPELDAALDGEW